MPIMIAAAAGALAQDGTGRSGSIEDRAPVRRPVPREPVRSAAVSPPVRRIELGKLALSVNEGESRIEITRLDPIGTTDTIPVTSRSSALIVRTLAAGNYRIAVSKPGYSVETREVAISDGRRQSLAIYLKPKMAFLTVAASVPDARIEIEKGGVYKASANRLLLKPGRYRVSVSRRGYISQSFNVDLKSPGREENLQVVLKPHRIDDVLDDAAGDLAKGDVFSARELSRDVLSLNPLHARANLIYGTAEMRSGAPEAIEHLLKAVRGGETFRIPLKLQEATNPRLMDAEISVDRDRISVKSAARFDLDFRILRGDITNLGFAEDPAPGIIFLSGKSDFHGRPISPELKLYPHDIAADPTTGTITCARSGCAREFSDLARFLLAWRAAN